MISKNYMYKGSKGHFKHTMNERRKNILKFNDTILQKESLIFLDFKTLQKAGNLSEYNAGIAFSGCYGSRKQWKH